jgi:hypothetical protein
LPDEDPEILARVLIWFYTRDVYRPRIEEETEKTLAKLVPKGPTTERSELDTYLLVYFCADRLGIECMKRDLASDVGSLIGRFERKDVDDDFTAFVEKVYNDIPARGDPLCAEVTVETVQLFWSLDLLQGHYRDDDSDDDSDDDAPKRIRALIRANEPAAWKLTFDTVSMFKGWG